MKRFVPFIVPCVLMAAAVARAEAPSIIPVQAFLTDENGVPLDDSIRLDVQLFDRDSGGDPLYTESHPNVVVEDGQFVIYLGINEPLDLSLFRDQRDVYLEFVINSEDIISPRTRLGSMPYAAHAQYCSEAASVPKADSEPDCGEGDEGRIYFDREAKQFLGCTGTRWVALSNAQPKQYRASATSNVDPPNTDKSCSITANSPWVPVPGMDITFDLERSTDVRVALSGSMADLNARTPGLHCGLRFMVDGAVGPEGTADWGHYLWSTESWQWHGLGSERRFALAAGTHTISVEARSGLCSTPDPYDASLCRITSDLPGSPTGVTLLVEVP